MLKLGNEPIQDFGPRDDPWQAGSGVRAGTYAGKVINVLAFIVRSEIGALKQDGLKLEGYAQIGIEVCFKILGSEYPFSHQVLAEVWNEVFTLKGFEDAVALGFFYIFPILTAAKMGHRAEDVKALTAFRS